MDESEMSSKKQGRGSRGWGWGVWGVGEDEHATD